MKNSLYLRELIIFSEGRPNACALAYPEVHDFLHVSISNIHIMQFTGTSLNLARQTELLIYGFLMFRLCIQPSRLRSISNSCTSMTAVCNCPSLEPQWCGYGTVSSIMALLWSRSLIHEPPAFVPFLMPHQEVNNKTLDTQSQSHTHK